MNTVSKHAAALILFLAGIVIGTIGFALVSGRMMFTGKSFAGTWQTSGHGTLATANQCSPKNENTEIFFISCGGIY